MLEVDDEPLEIIDEIDAIEVEPELLIDDEVMLRLIEVDEVDEHMIMVVNDVNEYSYSVILLLVDIICLDDVNTLAEITLSTALLQIEL